MELSRLTVISSSELLAIREHRLSNASRQALASVPVSGRSNSTGQILSVRITAESGIAVEVL
jgi:archaellum biogenesis ATPase FlaH